MELSEKKLAVKRAIELVREEYLIETKHCQEAISDDKEIFALGAKHGLHKAWMILKSLLHTEETTLKKFAEEFENRGYDDMHFHRLDVDEYFDRIFKNKT